MNDRLLAVALISGVPVPLAAQLPAPDSQMPAPDMLPPQGEEAIIPDAAFEEALPPIGDDMDAPLAPLESYAAPPPPSPRAPLPNPATAAPTQLAPIDVPPPGPALIEPLPPIAGFDFTPPPDAAFAQEEQQLEEVRYRLRLEGFEEVDLADRFRDLSALGEGDGEAANGAVVAARAEQDEELALRLLKSQGYYDAVVTSTIEPAPDEPGVIIATITAVPGAQYKLDEIAVTGAETEPPGLAREALGLQPGDPLIAALVEAEEANILLQLPQMGYPFVELGRRDVLLDPETELADYSLPVDPGPRSVFGGISTRGDLAFDARHVALLARFEPGQLYDSRLVDDLREAMVATSLFSNVAVEKVRTGVTGPDGNLIVGLDVYQDAGPLRTLAAQGGFQTGQGFTVRGSWQHRNLFPPEGALIVDGVLGTREQTAGVTFRRANAGLRDRTVSLALRGSRQRYEAYNALTASLIGRIARESTPIWQKVWTWSYGFELIASDENRRDRARVADRGTFFIGALPGQIGYDRSDDLLNPTRGYRLSARISPEISQRAGGSMETYARGLFDASAYYPVGDSVVIAGRARIGSIVGAPRGRIAPSRRLYAGGGGSVRGFGFQQLGPRDINNDPIGGRSLAEFALEARYRFGDYGIVPFVDIGQVYDESFPTFSDLRAGVGIGGRLYTNFGPIRVDLATPIDRRSGESRITVYISIGQAF